MLKLQVRKNTNGIGYLLYLLDDNKPVKVIDHTFKNMINASIYGNRLDNPLLSNHITKNSPKHFGWRVL